MKYRYQKPAKPRSQRSRRKLNQEVLSVLNGEASADKQMDSSEIFNAYTGKGGLHGLSQNAYDSYASYSAAKKEVVNGQFFTPPPLCELIMSSLRLSETDLVADLTCGMGNFFNYMPVENNAYGCEIDGKAYQVAQCLYPEANLTLGDIREYQPNVLFDYIVGNPPYHLSWDTSVGETAFSEDYYCQKAYELLKPLGIMAIIVPRSFLADSFTDGKKITKLESQFSFLGQAALPDQAFAYMGVDTFPTKIQFWQKRPALCGGWKPQPYQTEIFISLESHFHSDSEARYLYETVIRPAKEEIKSEKPRIWMELSKVQQQDRNDFHYRVEKLLYHVRTHTAVCSRYGECCNLVHRFQTQCRPENMKYENWLKVRLKEEDVLSHLCGVISGQCKKPERDEVRLVKQGGCFAYKAYSESARAGMTIGMKIKTPVYEAVLNNTPTAFPGFEALLRRKRREYENQEQDFACMNEDEKIGEWLLDFTLWDPDKFSSIHLNKIQRHDLNVILQKKYGVLQWEQGGGKTLAVIAAGLYRMQKQHIHSTWIVSSAISIYNNWDVELKKFCLPYVIVRKQKDLQRITPGDFVIITFDMVDKYRKSIKKWLRIHQQNVFLAVDESDELTNPYSITTKTTLDCFRRCRMKLADTGTMTRNNIPECAPQLELLYNNSINMISGCEHIYSRNNKDDLIIEKSNPYYGQPIPAYQKGYRLFMASHAPEKITVFGLGRLTQDVYNADVLNKLLGKTVITRTLAEIMGKNLERLHQYPVVFAPDEKEVYHKALYDFAFMQNRYFTKFNHTRKDSMMKLIQQIQLLLRISGAPDTVEDYTGCTPVKTMAVIELAAQWENEIVAVGVRHKDVLDSYVKAFREYLPDRKLFRVTGSDTTFAMRRKLKKTLRDSGNGILLCTQQSLPSSVNFEYVNKIIIPELHYNNAKMSQFYRRFLRFDSKEYKDIYFVTIAGSLESNLMQMVLAKEKLNFFMKGIETDLNAVNEKFGVDYDLLSLIMVQKLDENGRLHIDWGKQLIA